MFDHGVLNRSFRSLITQPKEIQLVWILQRFSSQIGAGLGDGPFEVGDSLTPPVEGLGLDLHLEDSSGPTILKRLLSVPETLIAFLELGQEHEIVAPGQFSNSCSKIVFIPGSGKGQHVVQIREREAAGLRERFSELL